MFFTKTFTSKSNSNESHINLIEIGETVSDRQPRDKLDRNGQFDPTRNRIRHSQSWRARFSGWRGGILMAAIISSITLTLNIVFAIVAKLAWEPKDGIATAFVGNCKNTGRWTIGLHLLINLLSSAILGASNFTMQRLAAPTRAEIDAAHVRRIWLDIGIPSIRNLFRISKKRTFIWLLLGLSSVPFHLFYNSVVFQTIAGHQVLMVHVIPEFFQENDNWSLQRYGIDKNGTATRYTPFEHLFPLIPAMKSLVLEGKYRDSTRFHNLTRDECINHYSKSFITDVGAGFAVINPEQREYLGLNETETLYTVEQGFGKLEVHSEYVSYCLAKVIEQKCRIEFSLPILVIVIAFGVLKVGLMWTVLWAFNQEALVTIGDAIQSFMEVPDPTTSGRCLMSSNDVGTLWRDTATQCPKLWYGATRYMWWRACSTRRWISCLFFYISVITGGGAIYRLLRRTVGIDNGGFGQADVDWLYLPELPYPDSIIPPVLLANLPQALISLLYLSYNGLFSCMLAGREWSQYAHKRAFLRVTRPREGQRSTYFIQVPFTWGVPIIFANALLHWLVSQTVFLVRVAIYKDGVLKSTAEILFDSTRYNLPDRVPEVNGVFTALGYSNTALVAALCTLGGLMCVCVSVSVACKYPTGLPLGGTNSAIISASCHVQSENSGQAGITEKPVMWGVTPGSEDNGLENCSFSASAVERPKHGHLYA